MSSRLKKALLLVGLSLVAALSAQAHTLRVLVTRPVTQPGFKNTAFLSYGHLLPVDEVIPADEVGAYQVHTPSGSVRPLEKTGRSVHANEVTFDEPGLYQVAVTRQPLTYVSYTDAAGKVGFARKSKNEFTLPDGAKLTASAKSYQFSKAVALHEVGAAGPATPTLGHPIEIVLDSRPGPLGYSADRPVQARVLFRGKPLAGAKVSAASTTRNPDGVASVAGETDADGKVALELIEPGTWVLDVLHLADSPAEARAGYDQERFVATLAIPVTDK